MRLMKPSRNVPKSSYVHVTMMAAAAKRPRCRCFRGRSHPECGVKEIGAAWDPMREDCRFVDNLDSLTQNLAQTHFLSRLRK